MLLKEMFEKPIDRSIKGVIKVGQNDDENIKQELEEYVVTNELQKHFKTFYSSYMAGIDGYTDKMGVWISGFFGSGKSHFLKILSYLLQNKTVEGKKAIEYFIEDNKIEDNFLLADMKKAANISSDIILFNIDSKSSSGDSQNNKEAILSVFLKVFNEHLGFYGANPHLADLERHLTEEKKYDAFKKEFFAVTNKEWEKTRQNFRFIQDKVCEVLVNIDFCSLDAAKNLCKDFTNEHNIDIDAFSKMVQTYIEEQEDNHHVVFLVDEIGQYIGDRTDLMLNLQTITEDLGTACKGKAWIIVTSQQDIDSITKVVGNDFSKIQGRFDTRLSLSSANVDEVIKKRILQKNTTALKTLPVVYEQKETILKNLILFNDGVEKKLFKNAEDFTQVYPFVPYQFDLLGNVLTSIREHGASGKHLSEGERSMLALFKESAVKLMEKEDNSIVSFYLFYDALEQFLDHNHSRVIKKALTNDIINPHKAETVFAVEVLKVLFLIKYIKEITPTIENITSLMVASLDDDRLTLQNQVEESLDILKKQTLVEQNGDFFIFLTNEEQEINREIKNEAIETTDIITKVSELIFDDIYDVKKYTYPQHSGKYNIPFRQEIDKRAYKNNQNFDIGLKIITPYFEDGIDESMLLMLSAQLNTVIVALPNKLDYIEELKTILQIEKYLRKGSSNNIATYNDIKSSKQKEIDIRSANTRTLLVTALENAAIYVNGDTLKTSATDIKTKLNEAFSKLVDTVYHKLSYIETSMTEASIRTTLDTSDTNMLNLQSNNRPINSLALQDVLEYIKNQSLSHSKVSMRNIIDVFSKYPYGFIEDDIEWLIAKHFKDGAIQFTINNEEILLASKTVDELYKYISHRDFRDKLLIGVRRKISSLQKKAVTDVMVELFQKATSSDDEHVIFTDFITASTDLLSTLRSFSSYYIKDERYPGQDIVRVGIELLTQISAINNSTQFYTDFASKKESFLDFAESFDPIKAFFNGQQVDIWKEALETIDVYEDSKTFLANSDADAIIKRISEIIAMKIPFSRIKDLPQCIHDYNEIYNEKIDCQLKEVFIVYADAKDKLIDTLEKVSISEQLTEKVEHRLTDLENKIKACSNLAQLQMLKSEISVLKTQLLNEIYSEEALLLKEKAATNAGVEKISQRVRTSVNIKDVTASSTWIIETEADLDNYISTLKSNIKSRLDDDKVVFIEF